MKTTVIQFTTERKDIGRIANLNGWVITKAIPMKKSGRANFELSKKTYYPQEDLKIIAEALSGVVITYKTIL